MSDVLPELKTFCIKCRNCDEKICVDRYSETSARRDLYRIMEKHVCK